MKYNEFYEKFKDEITGADFKALMKPYRVYAEIMDLQDKYSSDILRNTFFNSFITSIVEDYINESKPLTEKQKITVYYIKKQLEIAKAKLTRSSYVEDGNSSRISHTYFNDNDDDDDEDGEYASSAYGKGWCNGGHGHCGWSCDICDSYSYDEEHSGGI